MNRETWLAKASDKLCKQFIFEDLDVHVSVGWPSRGGLSTKKRVVGQCWRPETSKDGKSHIFISPMLEDAEMVLATLLHELIHAWDRCESGHKGSFIELAKKSGLERPWTATTPGEELSLKLKALIEELGPYPHVRLEPTMVEKKVQSTRMRKFTCDESGYIVRTTTKWFDELGAPVCPCHMNPMEPEVKGDE